MKIGKSIEAGQGDFVRAMESTCREPSPVLSIMECRK